MTDNQDKIFYLTNIKQYLTELSSVVGRTVEEKELLDANSTEELAQNRIEQNFRSISLPFKDLKSEKFKSFIDNMDRTKQGGVHVWIKNSRELGTFLMPSIKEFNLDIKFDDISGEVIVLTSEKGDNRLLLDFVFNDDMKQFIEIEISGNSWKNVDLSKFQSPIEE